MQTAGGHCPGCDLGPHSRVVDLLLELGSRAEASPSDLTLVSSIHPFWGLVPQRLPVSGAGPKTPEFWGH